MRAAERYEFGDVTVDFRRLEVRRDGLVVSLEPKTFEVLRHLLENRDRLVTKDELLGVVWKDTFVTPNVLTRAIAQLRKGIGDTAFRSRYIETVAKRGYRFIAPVVVVCDDPSPPAFVEREAPAPGAITPKVEWRWSAWVAATAVGIAVAAATLWPAWHASTAAGNVTVQPPKRLTITNHSHAFPSISPDGRSIAYTSDRSGAMEVYVAGFAVGSPELPITSDGGYNLHPAFSPDGRWLAYHSRKHGGIWIVPAMGGAARQVAGFGSMPSWSPDNETIVFTSDAGGMSSQALLWTVRWDGTALIALTKLGSPPGGHLAPAWSHDGRLVVFRVGQHAQSDLWMVSPAGGAPWRLGVDPGRSTPRFLADDRPSQPVFSPDDRAIYWIGQTADGTHGLMRIDLTSKGTAAGDPEPILLVPGKSVSGLSIGGDGTAVLSMNEGSTNLYAIDTDAAGGITPPIQLTFDDVQNSLPDYGLHGRVAFEQHVVGRPIASWLMDENGKNKELLTADLSASVQAPQWDASGRRVFAVFTDASSPPYFGWINVQTRQLDRIPMPSPKAATAPHLSPDGQQLAFHVVAPDGVMNAWVQRVDNGAARQVTFDRESMSYPRWSQDGAWLAVVIKRGDRTHVGVVPATGGQVEQLTFDRGQSWPYSFSANGDQVAFAGQREGIWNIYAVSRATKIVKQLTRFTTTDGHVRFPAWSPSGKRIVFEQAEKRGSLWTLKLPS